MIISKTHPIIPKHHLSDECIIKTEEDLKQITSEIDAPVLVLRVFDFNTMTFCGYHIITEKDALRALGAALNANNLLRKQVHDLTLELQDIKKMSLFEFGNKYCSSESLEEAGHQLAKDLLGK